MSSRTNAARTHVLLDGYELSASHHRGIGTYLRHLVDGLVADGDLTLDVLAARDVTLPAGAHRSPLGRIAAPRWRDQQHARRLPRALRGTEASVVHTPGRTVPARTDRAWVHTLHDLTPLEINHPELAGERDRWRQQGLRLRDAHAVITPSRATKHAALDHLGLDPARVVVIPHGVDPRLRAEGRTATTEGPPHILWVSSWAPHKGLADAIAVVDQLADRGFPHELRIIGGNDAWMLDRIHERAAAARHTDRVHVDGWVPDVGAAYRAATALLITSRAEGFCFPALEAMACGTPVVAYANTAITELVEDVGVLATDGDVDAIADAVIRVITDDELAATCAAAGLIRAADHTWAASVDAHITVYRAAASA